MRAKTMRCLMPSALILATAASSHADMVFHGVESSTTSTVLHGGDRELINLGFKNGAVGYTGANFANFVDGRMWTYVNGTSVGSLGWTDPIARDMSTGGNTITGNPDRADNASPFANEGASTGTLGEVFGTSSLGYKNMSWIIDGEEAAGARTYTIDLYFGSGMLLSADADTKTVEFALLERGRNSDLMVYGIRADGSLTDGLFISRDRLDYAGWKLNTLEIGEDQKVGGVGVSLDSSWTNLKGFRVEQQAGFNGPDIVAIGTGTPHAVPGPGALTAIALVNGLWRRRKR